jgi:hypothetical protein
MNVERVVLSLGGLLIAALVGFRAGGTAPSENAERVYELRTYTTLPGRLPDLHKRFAEHTMALFEKHGMRNEAYWVPTDSARADNTLIYLISHESREAANKSWRAFAADSVWIRARNASEAAGPILAKAPDRVFMTTTAYSPTPR